MCYNDYLALNKTYTHMRRHTGSTPEFWRHSHTLQTYNLYYLKHMSNRSFGLIGLRNIVAFFTRSPQSCRICKNWSSDMQKYLKNLFPCEDNSRTSPWNSPKFFLLWRIFLLIHLLYIARAALNTYNRHHHYLPLFAAAAYLVNTFVVFTFEFFLEIQSLGVFNFIDWHKPNNI